MIVEITGVPLCQMLVFPLPLDAAEEYGKNLALLLGCWAVDSQGL